MRISLLIIVFVLGLVSCNQTSDYMPTILSVESYIEERPDSALVTLQQINVRKLSKGKEYGKYSLLLSMAMDKNRIDRTDFDLLQPAIDYYKEHGSSTDRMRTCYYQGRIYHNQGKETLAMSYYLQALDKGENSEDILTKARILVAQSNIYYSLMKWNKVCDTNLQAADIFYRLNRTNSYINCLLKAVRGFIQQGEYGCAKTYLDICAQYKQQISYNLLSNYYSGYLTYLLDIKAYKDNIIKVLKDYQASVPKEYIDHIVLADTFVRLSNYDKAISVLQENHTTLDSNEEMRFFATLSNIYRLQGKYKDALECYCKFNKLNNDAVMSVFESDTQFMEERHVLELQAVAEREAKNTVILLSIIIGITLLSTIVFIRGCLRERTMKQTLAEKEAERYKLLYQQVEYEKDNLSEILSYNQELDKEARDVIAKRLELLNKFFTVYITNNSEINRKANKELEELLADKSKFMSSTRLAFAGSHPDLIDYLERHNLTEWEIEYCCLYALGLKGKEIGTYINMRSHYNISSEIRDKLGLSESDTNLGIYIRKLLDNQI